MDKLEVEFRKEVQTGDMARMRSFLTNSVIWDIDKKPSIENLIKVAEARGMFEELVNDIEKLPKNQWDGNYQDSVQTELMINYSKEKFLHFLEVAEYVENIKNKNKEDVKKQDLMSKGVESRKSNSEQKKSKKKMNQKVILLAIVLVVLLIAIKQAL